MLRKDMHSFKSEDIQPNHFTRKDLTKPMENFIYSINATIPVFLVMVIGYLLKKIDMLDDHFAAKANKFNFRITLPCLLFSDIAATDMRSNFDLKFVLFCAIVTSICFWGIWGASKFFVKDDSIRGAFVQASFRGSAAVFGIAFIVNIYGNSGMAPLMIIGAVPLYNIYSVIVLSFEAQDPDSHNHTYKNAIKNICTNPILLAILIASIWSLTGWYTHMPVIVTKTIDSFAKMASPLALVCIGVTFKGSSAMAKIKPTLVATALKLLIQPAIFLPIAISMGFTKEKLIALLIMLGSPTTPSCYIMAKNMHNDGVLTSSVVMLTTLASAITLTLWIFIIKSLGYL